MTNTDALDLARKLLAQHQLTHLNVTLSKTKNALGRCFFRQGRPVKIDLSTYWVNALSAEEIKDTILHEIAHAIAGYAAGHGEKWKSVCRRIGANPNRVADLPQTIRVETVKNISNYRAVCSNNACSNEVYFQRLTKNWESGRYKCGRCHNEFKPIDRLK
jgi:predicted SprT family Zn-dependent metalloprotease